MSVRRPATWLAVVAAAGGISWSAWAGSTPTPARGAACRVAPTPSGGPTVVLCHPPARGGWAAYAPEGVTCVKIVWSGVVSTSRPCSARDRARIARGLAPLP